MERIKIFADINMNKVADEVNDFIGKFDVKMLSTTLSYVDKMYVILLAYEEKSDK